MGTDISGKVALVTGSSRGIGRAVAQRLAAAGATVIVTGRSASAPVAGKRYGTEQLVPGTLAETVALIEAAGGKAMAIPADIEDLDAARDLVAKAAQAGGGRLDILVNNAGFVDFAQAADMSFDTFERTLTHYVRAPFVLSQAAIPHMREAGAGWIVNIGSQDSLPPSRPYPEHEKLRGYHVYAAAKAALNRLTQGMAAELVDANIAVNVIGPSTAIRTPGADSLIPAEFPTEDVAYLAESVLAMCHLPAAERTGLLGYSMHIPWHYGIEVRSLDGKRTLPRCEPPAWSHPQISASGE
ncbi:SDR family NAD(P)-dependent oxidoreductase (plasmid) [Novosphingobium sp. KACC 22771]|nr:SDR family NAD(P)-dependent oxidoreductase [Novosphingobium sp. KACC 22771]WDF75278.1 SDR family NAD(P)-dependent oxidoreductase [Novosphingobium sp. KACC 22771]